MLCVQWQFVVEFSSCGSCYFSILRPRPALSRGHLMCYLVEIACLCPPNRELSNGVWLEKLFRKKISISLAAHTTVTMYARREMSFFCTLECSFSPVLRSILLKLHILTRPIESFPILYGLWSGIVTEMSIPLGAHA